MHHARIVEWIIAVAVHVQAPIILTIAGTKARLGRREKTKATVPSRAKSASELIFGLAYLPAQFFSALHLLNAGHLLTA